MKIYRLIFVLMLVSATIQLAGCQRGYPTDKPPIHIIQDMYKQPKYLPQDSTSFFADGSIMRMPVEGTVARGWLMADSAYYVGIDPATGQDVKRDPLPVTLENLKRGQDRFNIFCTPCHGYQGDGKGLVIEHGFPPPPSFHSDFLRGAPDGHIYRVIHEGLNNMPSYGQQIPVRDRWAIVLYLRALQKSQNATAAQVPAGKK
jgi:mono/diheme cytochrome c family protein